MNIKEVLANTEDYFNRYNIDTPRLDAEVLLADLLDMERIKLYVNYDYPLTETELDKYRNRVVKRARHNPVAYITGKKEFMSLELIINEGVLIPRPETELLVEEVISYCKNEEISSPNIVDVGTGSGAIMVSLGYELDDARILGVDISPEAVRTAGMNIDKFDLGDRLKVIKGDLLHPLIKRNKNNVDIIVANPPYISKSGMDEVSLEVKKEPELALAGGEDGLQVYRKLIPQSKKVLVNGGLLALEIGYDQGEAVSELLADGWEDVELKEDYADRDRLIFAHRR